MVRWWLTLLLVNLALIATAVPRLGIADMPWLAVEGVILIAMLSLWPRHRSRRWLGHVGGTLIAIALLGALGDTVTQEIRGRLFNPYLDPAQLPIFLELLRDNLGMTLSLVLVTATLVILLALGCSLAHLLATLPRPRRATARTGVICMLILSLGALQLGLTRHMAWLGTPGVSLLAGQASRAYATHVAVRDFDARLAQRKTPLDAPEGQPLPGLEGRDVILAFVESYGMAALDHEPFAGPVNARLDAMTEAFAQAGLSVASGRLVSPTLGGQSRLAHASVLSGLWIDSTLRYDLFLESPRATLINDFENTGHTSVAMMPAIYRDWPAGRRLGYDEIHDDSRLDYRGPRLGWVTIPDQFVWHRLRQVRNTHPEPVFAELALISSHAPWVPVIEPLPWDELDDGKAFARWEGDGSNFYELWGDNAGMRQRYGPALAYSLAVAGEYATRFVDDDTLLILLGDHQAAPGMLGFTPSKEVPVHVISGDPALIAPFLAHGFQRGMHPPRDTPARSMAKLRGLLHRLYGATADTS
ncbi:alkaline phosphatase [Chromohalobacter sp. HP20-39]|uniref:alkaline phosphatase n=1 Tax=Chromohalobacter sp. HP20-39 TaxID=3079306 RepID=UPI00294B818D|nr:alkaline phosphatase [Chromohalobacter sp. HP20-39]MDV6319479.1 alkaline phosphatase [Chromohalobacter sp. HP20-39]